MGTSGFQNMAKSVVSSSAQVITGRYGDEVKVSPSPVDKVKGFGVNDGNYSAEVGGQGI